MKQPKILLLDEPCASIDAGASLQIEHLLQQSREQGVKILLVTHDTAQARRLADEYRLLDHLIQHPGRVFSREQLLDAVWGSDVYVEARTVDVHVGRLRKAIGHGRDPIRTVRGSGYSFDETFGRE